MLLVSVVIWDRGLTINGHGPEVAHASSSVYCYVTIP